MTAPSDDADERWRAVLFELVKRAKSDPEFRARLDATGAVIDNVEAVLERPRVAPSMPAGVVVCGSYWWGFQLEIPHSTLVSWDAASDSTIIANAIGPIVGPASPFRRRIAMWIANRLGELQQLDRGAGVYVSMTWMAPNIFVPIPIRGRS